MPVQPARRHYGAVFVLSLCLLMLEIAVARILSVALLSHYAFVAVSLAMFGLGLSALMVYLFPNHFRAERVDRLLVAYAWRFGLSAVVCVVLFLRYEVVQMLSVEGFVTLAVAYTLLAVPFFFGGTTIALAMTHFSAAIARIYAADLIGASVGCLLVVAAMEIMPAPVVPLVVGGLACATALALAFTVPGTGKLMPAAACAIVAALAIAGLPGGLFRMQHVKIWQNYSKYEAWNAFARVSAFTFTGNAGETLPLKQPAAAYGQLPATMMLDIDGTAWTPMVKYDGNTASLAFLRDSVLYTAHHLRPEADVLIIGTGGGRDILAAHAFGQRSVLGIELNPLMRHIVDDVYGDYSGRPYSQLGATVIIDEARSRLAAIDERFDIIQLSLIDTFSLNAAGGFVFSENFLYTREAFEEYFAHLREDGLLSVTRYYAARYPLEILRVVGMVREAWARGGVPDVSRHIVVLHQQLNATVLAKRSPFTDEELRRIDELAQVNHMRVLYRPGAATQGSKEIAALVTTLDPELIYSGYEFNIEPVTDDRPFFFHFLPGRLAHLPSLDDDPMQVMQQWSEALSLMYLLILVVTTLALLCFVGPLLFLGRAGLTAVPARVAAPLLFYFACLGYGFMMIEIPLMQRLILFLGYPVYALAVVLFALLLFSGLGSLASARFAERADTVLPRVLLAIVALAIVYIVLLPPVLGALMRLPVAAKIATTVVLLAPLGGILGMAYPLGITILRRHGDGLVPWAWGLNGALSVVASVLAIFVSSRLGLTAALLTGAAAYLVALLCLAAARGGRASATSA
jgi:spermidine synthase